MEIANQNDNKPSFVTMNTYTQRAPNCVGSELRCQSAPFPVSPFLKLFCKTKVC